MNPEINFIDTLKYQKPKNNNLSYSSLKAFNKSPLDFLLYINKDYTITESMILGSLIDCLLLTPENFESKYLVVGNYDRRTKSGKELHDKYLKQSEKENKEIVKKSIYDKCCIIVNSIKNNHKAKYLLEHTHTIQYKVNFNHKVENEIYNIRGFADGVGEFSKEKPFIFDLKTTNKIDQHFYTRQIIDLMYHLQASIYTMGYFVENFKFPDFYHIVVETSEPYKVNVFKFDNEFIKTGKDIFKSLLQNFHDCKKNNSWNQGSEFFEPNIVEITTPEWYNNLIENE
tara:strand:- start:33364 stop:34218 length:855 start_codon:yes stop_codon:yes gene_type:complete